MALKQIKNKIIPTKRITKYVAILSFGTLVINLVSQVFMYVPEDGDIGIPVFPGFSPLTLLVIFALFLVSSVLYFLLKK
jgi:hypothetical protein